MILRIALHISSFAYVADVQVFVTTIQHIGLKGQRSFRTNCICVIFAISDMDWIIPFGESQVRDLKNRIVEEVPENGYD